MGVERLNISQQTLQQFLDAPFGIPNQMKNLKYEDRYQAFKKNNKIRIESSIEFEKNYFIHVQVPSESNKGLNYYDVVVQFFTPNPEVEKELSVEHYYVQFFSNSPGFVYKYSALYKMQGYLIESLYDKFDPGVLNILPDKANSSYELYFDSSIYYACRYLLDNKLRCLGKFNIKIFKTKPVKNFFNDIQDVESANISRQISSIESKLRTEIAKDSKLSVKEETKIKNKNDFYRREIGRHNKKKAKEARMSTLKDPSQSAIKKATVIGKKKATHSTVKK